MTTDKHVWPVGCSLGGFWPVNFSGLESPCPPWCDGWAEWGRRECRCYWGGQWWRLERRQKTQQQLNTTQETRDRDRDTTHARWDPLWDTSSCLRHHTWFVDGVGDEILPQLCIVLLFSKLYGFVHVLQFLHDHLQGPSAVPHPACEQTS